MDYLERVAYECFKFHFQNNLMHLHYVLAMSPTSMC